MGIDSIFMVRTWICWRGIRAAEVRSGRRRREEIIERVWMVDE